MLHPSNGARRRFLMCSAAGTLLALPVARAQSSYPDQSVSVVVPFPPGGSADILARVLAQALGTAYGQSFIVENRAGGGGAIGIAQVARARPDGYTLGVTSLGPQVLLKAMGRDLPYDPASDILPCAHMGSLPLAAIARKGLEAATLDELVALARSRPGKLSFGSSGVPGQLAIEQFKLQAGIDMLHVPYKGDAPMAVDLIGGQIDMALLTVPAAIPHLGSDAFTVLATTGAARPAQLPDVLTATEQGYPGLEVELWYVLAAPSGTPRSVVAGLEEAVAQALEDPQVMAQFAAQGLSQRPMNAATVRQFIEQERRKWTDVIKQAGLTFE